MPRILELKEIDGELWCRVGKLGEFPSGVGLFTPEEIQDLKYKFLIDVLHETIITPAKELL